MIDIFDICYSEKFRSLRKNRWEKETELAKELDLRQQEVSLLLNGGQHFTDEIILRICKHYKVTVSEFRRLEYTDSVMIFVRQLCKDAGGTPFNDQTVKLKELSIANCLLRKNNLMLTSENHSLKWEAEKSKRAAEIVSEKIKTKIYVSI